MSAGVVDPQGCAECGIPERGHARQVGADGSHTWERPSDEQVKARMLARRAARLPLPTVPELDRLRSELAVSEQRSERRRIAWRMARQRAISIGGAADRYAARASEGQTALQDMLAALLEAQIERDAAQARVEELLAERHSTNEALSDAAEALRRQRDRINALEKIESRWAAAERVVSEARDKCNSLIDTDEVADALGLDEPDGITRVFAPTQVLGDRALPETGGA